LDENQSDNILRAALGRNDPAAVELMWDRYAGDLLTFLQAVLCSRPDAEDVLQTVFVKIARKRHRLAKARCLDSYIYRIARNEAYGLISHRKRNKKAQKINEHWLIASEDNSKSSELAEQLQATLAQLPQQQREVIIMKIYRQKTFQEISGLLGLSRNTVASRYRYGIEKLRNLLGNLKL
jgi:RNA polymerase sigma-70 factor (ECF subfamily)